MKSFFLAVTVVVGLLVVGVVLFVFSGFYNVGADVPHWGITFSILDIARERSVEVHSDGISVPPLKDPELVTIGFPHFHEICRLCHGAPGYDRAEFAEGFYPRPPHLGRPEFQNEITNSELYWIVKHGLKMTGMPAFGVTHDDKALWGITAFVRRLPGLSAEEYETMVKNSPHHEGGEKHDNHHKGA